MTRTLAATLLGVAACAGAQSGSGGSSDLDQFSCDGRRVEYMVAGGFVAAEAGVTVECDGDAPQLTKWRLDDSGQRDSSTHALSGGQFEALWKRVDSTGWRYLDETCPSTGTDGDPIYTIGVTDHALSRSYICTGKTLPFPYDRVVNELDLLAAGMGDGAAAPI